MKLAGVIGDFAWSTTGILAVSVIIAENVVEQKRRNICDVVSGNVDNRYFWQYQASHTDHATQCDTAASDDTIRKAVEKAITYISDKKFTVACLKLTHGGTWIGNLQISITGQSMSAVTCAVGKTSTNYIEMKS